MTAPGFGPEQAQHLLSTLHGLDTIPAAIVRPALAVGLVGTALAVGLGKVGERMRLAPSVRPPGTRPTVGREGTAAVDAHGGGRRKVLRDVFDIAEQSEDERLSYWGDILVERSVILWHGPPKTGKSTLLSEGLKHIIRGEPYLGWPTTKTAAVYFSEETSGIWRDKAAGIAGVSTPACPWWQAWMPPGPVSWAPVRRPSVAPKWWRRMRGYRSVFHVEGPSIGHLRGIENLDALMAYADGAARARGASLIIFDTLKHFCSEAQSASEHADRYINACKGLAARGYCVVIVHHDNDDGKPLGPKSLQGGVDALVHQHRVKGLPQRASEREVEFEGRFTLGGAPETLRYHLDPQTLAFVRDGASTGRTNPRTFVPVDGPSTSSPGEPLPLPILTPPTPLRIVRPVLVGKAATRQAILAHLATMNGGPWTRTVLRNTLVGAGVVARSAAYGHLNDLLKDGQLVERADGTLALTKAESEATA